MKFQVEFTHNNTDVTEVLFVSYSVDTNNTADILQSIQLVANDENKICNVINMIPDSGPVRGKDITGKVLSRYLSILSENLSTNHKKLL